LDYSLFSPDFDSRVPGRGSGQVNAAFVTSIVVIRASVSGREREPTRERLATLTIDGNLIRVIEGRHCLSMSRADE